MRRDIVLSLILANLVFFLWSYSQPMVVPERKRAELPPGAQSLILLSERNVSGTKGYDTDVQRGLSPDPSGRSTTDAPSSDVERLASAPQNSQYLSSAPNLGTSERGVQRKAARDEDTVEEKAKRADQVHCYTLGPFLDRQIADVTAAEIKAIGFPVTQRSLVEREIKHYWIYLAPFKDDRAAQEASKKLAKNRVKDYFIVTAEENRNAISLGLFKRKGGAQRRARRISELGFQPEIEVRYRDRTYYWLDYEETGDYPLPPQLWQSIETEKGAVQRLSRDCA